MAELKKVSVTSPAAKAPVEAKTEEKAVAKAAPKKEAAPKKPAAKKVAAPKKPAAKKPAAKKASTKTVVAKKSEVVRVEFNGKSYTQEDLIKSAKDVWQYDIGKKAAELKSIELYVKPEEERAYYVFNNDITGSFSI